MGNQPGINRIKPPASQVDSDGVPYDQHNRARLHRLADGNASADEKAHRAAQIEQHYQERQASHPYRDNIPRDWLDDVPSFDQSQGMDPGCGRT